MRIMETRQGFSCTHCGTMVAPAPSGTRNRNHCPHCLHSLHLDIRPGDRANPCRGVMEPVALWRKANGELAIIHRCSRCGELVAYRIAGDDAPAALSALARQVAEPG
jgi:predicted RNA-binding Zn-ribbon protein involved in translation (DUF1610 family)